MSDDIVFTDSPTWVAWSARSAAFQRLMTRVRGHCFDDVEIGQLLTEAEASGALALCDIEDVHTRTQIIKCILAAASEWRDEMPVDAVSDREWMTELINLARQSLDIRNESA